MREQEILRGALTLTLLLAACKSEPAAEPASNQASQASPSPSAPEAQPEDEPGPPTVAEPEPEDPERADKLADLDAMCEALDRDYVDGTLTDYYRDVEPTTAWGKQQRDAGNKSMKPGRLLEQAVAALDPDGDDPGLPNCRKLLDYLDDVE